MRIPALLFLLSISCLAIVGTSAYADGPSPQSGKPDSPVSPLLLQFIEQREDATPDESQQPAAGAFPRSQPAAGPAARDAAKDPAKDPQDAQTPGASGAVYAPVRFDSAGRVQVYINLANTADPTLQQLRDLGADIEVVNHRWSKLQAWVPVDALDRITQLDAVRYITPPDYASTKAGSVLTEGDGIHRADLVRNLTGLTGKGVRVGVISDGVDSWRTASATGDLPNSLQVNPNVSRTGDEGTALLEIVHDLAPDAQLAFSSSTSSLVMAEAILWLANNAFNGEGVDIIVDDLNIKDPFFEDGPVAQAAQDAVDGGVVFVSAAGNDARRHYEADFVDAGDGFHAFDGDSDTSLRVFGASAGAILQWNDPFGASGNDYDMYICPPGLRPVKFNLQNRICRASDRVQDGDDDPVEGVILLHSSGYADIYIRKFSGDDRRLELFLEYQFGTIREHGVPEGSVIAHPAAAGVLAVGAISADDPGNDDAQSISARGPSIFIDPDDHEKTVSRNKPDVMGIDNVLVTGAGGFGLPLTGDRGSKFPGTSAAAPHVAGIAALVMEAQRLADPGMTKKEVADAVAQTIRDTAFDLGDFGYDGTFGYGRADAFAAVESIAGFELYSREPFTFQFTVNSTGDGADSSTTDATCDDGSGNCTLRAAIQQANALSSGVIEFNISGTGTQTISPASALPTITRPVFIDGYSQPGASAGTLLIELDGAILSLSKDGTDADGLTLSGEDSVVRGLVVNGFEGNGIVLQGSSGGQFLEGNHIGTNVDGSVDDGNGSAGVYVNGAPGVLLRDNVISGNDSHGVHVSGGGASGVVLQGNTIGLNAAGAADLGNTGAGVHIGGAPDAFLVMNTISGNDSHGISVSGGGASGASISGNTIGLNAAGDASVGNTGSGVHISGAEDAIVAANSISGNGSHGVALTGAGTEDPLVYVNYIGTNGSGDSLGNGGSGVHIGDSSLDNSVEGNTIANNSGDGVTIVSSGSTGNTIRKNSIHTNTGHGIDLGDDGATANDTGDADTGPNSLRNYPTDITFAVRDDAASARFKIDSIRSQEYIVDYYECDSSSSGEGKEWLGFSEFRAPFTDITTRTVDTFRGELEEYSAPTGTHVTATVTELQTDSTSEFAPCVETVDLPELDLSVDKVEVTEDSTTETTYSIALAAQPSDTVRVQIVVFFASRSDVVNPNPGSVYIIPFTTMNWSEPVSVTVYGVTDDDALHESNEIHHKVSIGGGTHLTAILPVFVTDDEAPGTATLTSTTSGVTFPADVSLWQEYDGILELDEGDTFTYTVELDEEPEGDVVVETFYVGADALTVTPASITFTETGEAADADKWEWDDPQTVTLTALHDSDERNELRTVRHRVEVGGEDYIVAQLSLEIRDLALSGLTFDLTDLAVTVDEGGTATYTVALDSDPGDGATATVEISVESGPFDNAIYVSPDDLTFTGGASGNWSTPQTVTVTGRNDDDEFDDPAEVEHILKVGSRTGLGRNVEVTVIDGNRAPYFLEGTHTTRRVSEGAGQDDEVGDPVEALDLNASDTLTYSLEDTSGKFSIDSGTGQIKVAADGSLDYETATWHDFEVIAKDDGGLSDRIDATVLVRNVDEPLEVTGDTSPIFNENSNINNAVARYTARDPEGTPVAFTWSLEGTDGSDFSIDSSGNVKFTSQPDYETQDEYSITVVATDTADSFNSGELAVTVAITDVNEAPEIIGSGSETYQENQTHPVATFGFIDREGDAVVWTLAGTDRGDFTINTNGQLQFASTPDFESPADSGRNNEYNLTIVATDNGTPPQVARLDLTVTVEDVNEAPSTPSGSASITVAENSTGNLARYTSSDPERRTIQWSITGTDAAAFRIDSSGNLAFDRAPDYENARDSGGNNEYNLTIVATDNGTPPQVARLDLTVTVEDVNEAPSTPSGSASITVAENSTGNLARYTSSDPERRTIQWSITGTDAAAFRIDSSGNLAFDRAPDYENARDSGGNNAYDIAITASDDGNLADGTSSSLGRLSASFDVTVTVTPVDEPPLIAGTSTFDNRQENNDSTIETYTAADPEGNTPISWSLGGTDRGDFTLTGGELKFASTPDYERPADSGANNHYEIILYATDSNSKRAELHIDIIVKNIDEPPTIAGPETVDGFPENSPASRQVARYTATDPEGATVALTLTGTGSADFNLASNGAVTFKESPDYEDDASYSFTVRAVAGSHTINKPVTVNIENLEERGAVTLSTVQPQTDTPLTATLEDDDGPTATTWQWYRTSSRSSAGTAITSATSATYTPVADDVGSYLRAAASYDDGFDTSNTAAAVSANRVQVRPPDPAPPVFAPDGDYERSVRENTRASTNLGAPVTATDINSDKLTYSIDDTTNFEIVESTGQLRTRVELDHEEQASRSVLVTATDPNNTSDNVTVTITVENVDETPVVSGPATVDVAENADTSVATYAATDPDDTGIDWILTGTDSGPFALSGGVLTFNEVPDDEEKNNYRVTVEAHERSPGTGVARLSVAVRVTNIDEPGMVEANVESPRVGQALRLGVEDEDDGESVTEWKWERGDPNSPCGTGTNWQTIPRATSSSYTPIAADQGKCLRVTAIYNDRAGTGNTVQYITAETVEFGPYFDSDTATASVPEDSAEGRSVGQFRARHSNSGEALTYSLTGGDTGYFTIDDTGQLRTSATPLDYEGQPGPEAVAEITAEDNGGETATITVTVSVTDVCDTATSVPGRPAAPNVSAASSTSLRASWSSPSGPCIASYELQYRQTGNTGWSSGGSTGTTRSRTITGLSASTTYEVQVRARNSEGPGGWSPTGTATTSASGGVGTGGGNEGGGSGDTGGSWGGGGGGAGFAFAGGGGGAPAPAQPRTVNNFQSPQQIFQPLVANGTLQRVWRFFALGQRWLFYDPRPSFQRFNTLRTVNVASDPPAILLVNSTRQQQFRGYTLFEGWNFVPIEAEPPAPRPGRNLQQLSQLLRPLVQNGTLQRVWRMDPRTQGWQLYDPDPAFASVNTLSAVDLNANPPVVLAVSVSRRTEFRGGTLYPGWNYILMR